MKETKRNNFNTESNEIFEIFEKVTENIDDIIWSLDLRSQKFTYISPSVKKVRGVSAEDAMKSSLKSSLPPDEYEKINTKINKIITAAKEGEKFSRNFKYDLKHYNKNNEIIWLEVKASIILDKNNIPHKAIGVSREITSDKNQRIELEKSLEREKFFADIIRNTGQPIGIVYKDGLGIFLNAAGMELLGYTKDEALNLNWTRDLTPKKWHLQEAGLLENSIKSKEAVIYKKEFIHKDGKIIPVELLAHPKFDSNGKFLHFITFIKDISEIEKTKRELYLTNERLEFALKGANDGIWDWDLKTNHLYMSPRYLEMLGYEKGGVRYHIDFFNGLLKKTEKSQVQQFAKNYKTNSELRTESTFDLKHKEGHFIPVLSRAYKILSANGIVERIVGTHTDLTEFNALKDLLEENEAKYKYLFDQTNIGIGISTLDGKVLEANEYLMDLIQVKRENISKIRLKDFYKIKKLREQLLDQINREGNVKNFRFELLQKSGKSVWVSLSSKKIMHKGEIRLINALSNIDQQIKAEKKLKESEERFKQLSKLTTEGILIHNKGIILDINDSLLKILGYTRNEMLGKDFANYCCSLSNTINEIYKIINSSYQTNEIKLVTKKGERIPVEVSGRKANFKERKVQVTSFLDISSRLESERKIQLLNTAIEQSDHAIIITDEKGNIEYINPKFTEITKYEPQDIIRKPVTILESGFHKKIFYKNLWETIYTGNIWQGEIRNKDKSGKSYWVSATISPIKNKNGVITNFISRMEDISQRKKEREELEKLNTRLKLAVEAANFGFWEHNMETSTTYWDDNMYDFFNMVRDEYPQPYDFFSKNFLNNEFDQLKKNILYGLQQKNVVDIETISKIQDENKVFRSYILENPVSPNGEKSIIGITYDITQQKKFQDELIEKRKKAEESDQLKSAFLANMSHEIRTPLNGIIGFTSLLEDEFYEFSEEEIKRYLRIISANGKHLLSLVNDIIDLSKIESGQLVIAHQDFVLGDIISKLEDTFKNSTSPKVDLIFDYSLVDLKMRTDSTRLTQILTNLISNSLKFTKVGHVLIGHKKVGKFIQIWVEDTGSGIKDEAKSRIFERFAQGQPIKDQLLGGTGLGLSITKGLVKLLGGNIWFESAEGKGSTFYFKILIDNS